ncbi:osmoprotectant transport system substrate-binding protein [Streptomyces sp. 846.5]|nr:ABC transporter substrate-binding protein [Streptomyces sp. 846.5]TDU04967.1 osmoprotectant transport system substrate-binding protein [Streptomyces sp. 846.5]
MTTSTTRGRTRIAAVLVASAAAVSLAACGSSSSSSSNPLAPAQPTATGSAAASGPIIVGSNNFAESTILADIYGEALKAKGLKVTYKPNIGSREVSYGLLKSGTVTLMPEYNGALLAYLDPKAVPTTLQDNETQLAAKVASNLQILTPAAAEDKDSLTVNAATATKYHLTASSKISDLKSIAGQLVLGAAPEFQTRQEGVVGLKAVYGLTFKSFKALDAGGTLTEAALQKNDIQVGDIFTTDSTIAAQKWITLQDDKSLFGFQNVIPVAQKTLPQTAVDALNAVSAKLDTATLMDLDAKVGAKGADPLAVADAWLKTAGLTS